MTTRIGTVHESNSAGQSVAIGSLGTGQRSGMRVLGVHLAGQRNGNVGAEVEGIYGTLQVDVDGRFTYRLDNNDTDTDLLASGETAIERFTVTYSLGSVTQTVAVEIAVNGLDEPGQEVTLLDGPVEISEDTVIGRDEVIRFTSGEGFLEAISYEYDPRWDFVNFGSISLEPSGDPFRATTLAATPPLGRTLNYGRVTVNGPTTDTRDVSGVIDYGENHGVISARYSGGFEAGRAAGRAVGMQGTLVNTGLIEAISDLDAYGVWAFDGHGINNSGFIYVEGGASWPLGALSDPLGIIGFRSGGTGGVDNSGAVHVVSNAPEIASVGFRFFMNSTNIYNPINFDNSGTIVADRAVVASGNFQSSTYLINTGHVEGTLELLRGVNQVTNGATGNWAGDFLLGSDPDLVMNAGRIVGSIDLALGHDIYRGFAVGTVSGTVSGGLGNDLLSGGNGADRLSGGDGLDWIAGGAGADRLTGGADADIFVYGAAGDSTAAARDTITDFVSGIDRIDISAIGATGFTLSPSGGDTILRAVSSTGTLEVLVNGAVAVSDIVTVAVPETVDGTAKSDIIVADTVGSSLLGGGGSDALHGSAGDDLLDGGAGADMMAGGAGNDVYVLDDFGDLVHELEDGGIDEIRTLVSTILPSGVENGRLLGNGGLDLGGNALDNILFGNSGFNRMNGGDGNDIIIGGLGPDEISMLFGDNTAVYRSLSDSTREDTDSLLFFDWQGDRVDLTAFEVIGITAGEHIRLRTTTGASLRSFDGTLVEIETTNGSMVIAITGTPELDAFLFDRPADGRLQLSGLDADDTLIGGRAGEAIDGRDGNDTIQGLGGVDLITGGLGFDVIDGGSDVDYAVVRGVRADYTVTQIETGLFEVVGPDGTDRLSGVEFLRFDDQEMRLRPGEGVSVTFETADPSVYQSAMNAIRDFDGNDLGGDGAWLRIGSADVNGDGDIDQILVNDAIGRFATVGTAPDGLVYFEDYSWAGETRVAGIYIDPLVEQGIVERFSDEDSQRRFQNDLQIENINRVLGADDYDGDGIQEVYFALTDGTAYLRALMHEDGNIRYANYQSEQEVIDYLTANGFGEETFGDWFADTSSQAAQEADADKAAIAPPEALHERGDIFAGATAMGVPMALHGLPDPLGQLQAYEVFG